LHNNQQILAVGFFLSSMQSNWQFMKPWLWQVNWARGTLWCRTSPCTIGHTPKSNSDDNRISSWVSCEI